MVEKIERKDAEFTPYKDLLQTRISHDRYLLSGIKKILEEARNNNIVSCAADSPAILTESDNSDPIKNPQVYISLKFNNTAFPGMGIDIYDEIKVMVIESQLVLIGDDSNTQFRIEEAEDVVKQAILDPPLKNDFYDPTRRPSEKMLKAVRDIVRDVEANCK
jgi:hypothetical protein